MLDNPVIGCIESIRHDFEGNPSFLWNAHPGVGHQCDTQAISGRDAIHLLFDRARIGIYKDMKQCLHCFT